MKPCLVVLGPTATGKTALAVQLAARYNGEIISADSRQVYKKLDLGSGKDLCEFTLTGADGVETQIPYHLIDVADVRNEYSVFDYQKGCYSALADVYARGKLPVLAGGTGMYLDAVVRGYDLLEVPPNIPLRTELNGVSLPQLAERLLMHKPELHNSTDLTERHRVIRAIEIAEYERTPEAKARRAAMPPRPDMNLFVLGVTFPRDVLRKRITIRLRERLKAGMIDEVRALHDEGVSWERLERLGLEYRYVSEFLQGKIASEDEFFKSLNIAIGQFAKRQETWFRGMERKGVEIHWIPTTAHSTASDVLAAAVELIDAHVSL